MSIKTTLLASASPLQLLHIIYKRYLYIVNSGSKGGSYNGQLSALAAGLSL